MIQIMRAVLGLWRRSSVLRASAALTLKKWRLSKRKIHWDARRLLDVYNLLHFTSCGSGRPSLILFGFGCCWWGTEVEDDLPGCFTGSLGASKNGRYGFGTWQGKGFGSSDPDLQLFDPHLRPTLAKVLALNSISKVSERAKEGKDRKNSINFSQFTRSKRAGGQNPDSNDAKCDDRDQTLWKETLLWHVSTVLWILHATKIKVSNDSNDESHEDG